MFVFDQSCRLMINCLFVECISLQTLGNTIDLEKQIYILSPIEVTAVCYPLIIPAFRVGPPVMDLLWVPVIFVPLL